MSERDINAYINTLLPLYANGRANRFERRIVRFWLKRNEEAAARFALLEQVKQAAQSQRPSPSAKSWAAIQSRLDAQPAAYSLLDPKR